MLKRKALKKILVTTLTMFIILVVYTVPTLSFSNSSILRTNLEIKDITGIKTDSIYLLNRDGYFVKVEVFLEEEDLDKKILKLLEYLKDSSDKIPMSLTSYIPSTVQLLNCSYYDYHVELDFSQELLENSDSDKIITGIVYSLLEQSKIKSVSLLVEGKKLENYQNIGKEIGINKEYLFSSHKGIQKVVIYYLDSSSTYYVPVTKYLNDEREKIEIIVEELKNIHEGLVSLCNIHTELLDYREVENVMFLNFNEYLLDDSLVAREKLFNTIALSVFDNYDVNMVMFEVNHETIRYISRK